MCEKCGSSNVEATCLGRIGPGPDPNTATCLDCGHKKGPECRAGWSVLVTDGKGNEVYSARMGFNRPGAE